MEGKESVPTSDKATSPDEETIILDPPPKFLSPSRQNLHRKINKTPVRGGDYYYQQSRQSPSPDKLIDIDMDTIEPDVSNSKDLSTENQLLHTEPSTGETPTTPNNPIDSDESLTPVFIDISDDEDREERHDELVKHKRVLLQNEIRRLSLKNPVTKHPSDISKPDLGLGLHHNLSISAEPPMRTSFETLLPGGRPRSISLSVLNLKESIQEANKNQISEDEPNNYKYEATVYGRYREELSTAAKNISEIVTRDQEVERKKEQDVKERRIFRLKALAKGFRDHSNKLLNLVVLYLLLLGMLVALAGFAMDTSISFLHYLRVEILESIPTFFLRILYFLFVSLFLVTFSILFTKYVNPAVVGSGIPEMKAILSGVTLNQYLSFRALIAKIIGLTTAVGSGLVIGKEGPFVHTASIIANQLQRVPIFKKLAQHDVLTQQVLSAACGAGVAANYGSPIGGTLFSIEVTSTYYPVRNYWLTIFASVIGAIFFRILHNWRTGGSFLTALFSSANDNTNVRPMGIVALGLAVIIGIIFGFLGAFFVKINSKIVRWRRRLGAKYKLFRIPLYYALFISVCTSILCFPYLLGEFMSASHHSVVNDLWTEDDINSIWLNPSKYISMPIYFVIKFILLSVSISLPLPCGLYMPLLCIGAAAGRLCGEILTNFPYFASALTPGGLAIVGAASLVGAVTQTFSSAVIVMELIGHTHYLIPVLVAVIIGMSLSRILGLSIYDQISIDRGLPYLPDIQFSTQHSVAANIMDPEPEFLTETSSLEDINTFLNIYSNPEEIIAITNSKGDMNLLGTVKIKDLEKIVVRESDLLTDDVTPESFYKKEVQIEYSTSPIQFIETTPIHQIHHLFINLRLDRAFVTKHGKLCGTISRKDLKGAIKNKYQ